MKKNYNCIDLVKFICALMVVAIHIAPLSTYSESANYIVQDCLTRIAVPFFFTAAGFFLFKKTDPMSFDAGITLDYAKKILKFYLIWTLIYSPLIVKIFILGDTKGPVIAVAGWLRCLLLTGSYPHLWYLNATIVAVLLLTALLKLKLKPEKIVAIGALLYVFGMLAETYSTVLSFAPALQRAVELLLKVIVTTRNGVFEGLFFMSIGMLFAYRPCRLAPGRAAVGFAVSMLLLLAEGLTVRRLGCARGHDLYAALLPAVVFLFALAANTQLADSPLYAYLRKSGSLIFYTHLIWSELVNRVFANSILRWLGTVLLSFGMAHLIIKLSDKKNFRFLKKIY